ncbi:MAG: TetR/AcrR family transcriptional regulator [Ilumatobacter sp.]|nr:MAG: TetR/AcrR family transcriptional regulator [Ilumatobacter sp.]
MGRSEDARRKVLEAGVGILLDDGVPAFTVEAVAKRSGVAKTTIYRHWPDPDQLLVDTLRSTIEPIPTPNTGSLQDDLEKVLADLAPCDPDDTDRQTRMLFGVLQRAADEPALLAAFDDLMHERFGPIRTLLELAQGRGDIVDDLDLDLAVDLVIGPLLHRHLMRRQPVDPADTTRVVHHVIAGLRP